MGPPLHCYTCAGWDVFLENWGYAGRDCIPHSYLCMLNSVLAPCYASDGQMGYPYGDVPAQVHSWFFGKKWVVLPGQNIVVVTVTS